MVLRLGKRASLLPVIEECLPQVQFSSAITNLISNQASKWSVTIFSSIGDITINGNVLLPLSVRRKYKNKTFSQPVGVRSLSHKLNIIRIYATILHVLLQHCPEASSHFDNYNRVLTSEEDYLIVGDKHSSNNVLIQNTSKWRIAPLSAVIQWFSNCGHLTPMALEVRFLYGKIGIPWELTTLARFCIYQRAADICKSSK